MKRIYLVSVIVLLGVVLLAGIKSGAFRAEDGSSFGLRPVKSNQVCMVNDRFMGVEQMPVAVNGTTYYGCCQGCVSKLQNNKNGARFSSDPVTGEPVDKAQAYIVNVAEGPKNVLYFQSKSTYQTYLKQLALKGK